MCEYKSSRLKKNRREKLIGCFFQFFLGLMKKAKEKIFLERKKERKKKPLLSKKFE